MVQGLGFVLPLFFLLFFLILTMFFVFFLLLHSGAQNLFIELNCFTISCIISHNKSIFSSVLGGYPFEASLSLSRYRDTNVFSSV